MNYRQTLFAFFAQDDIEARRFELRGEMFNVPNHPNFNVPSGLTVFSNATTIAPNWGVISTTVATSRQIQLGLKFIF